MSKHVHHLNDDGTAAVCTADNSADCRMRTRCDSEGWMPDGCVDHGRAHRVLPSPDCWMVEHLNFIDLRETCDNWQDPPAIIPGAPIEIEFLGSDEGCSWAYTEVTPPAELSHGELDAELTELHEAEQQDSERFKLLWAEAEKRGML